MDMEISKILEQNITDNVVELMSSKILELPVDAKKYLSIASCLGNKFKLNIIALISNTTKLEIAESLDICIQEGFLFPVGTSHKKLLNSKMELDEVIEYKFVHDRIQQAAYNLLSEIERKDLHIRIGYAIYENSTEKEVEENIFEIVSHLNHSEIESLNEENKTLLIKLNLQAAKKAKSATAYNAAYNYLSYV